MADIDLAGGTLTAGATSARPLKPTAALYETTPRGSAGMANAAILSTGRLSMVAIWLPIAKVITSISFSSGTQALVLGTHQWFALYDSARALLRQTTNDTSTAWAASTIKPLNLTSTFTTTYTGLHYLGIMVEATTPPSNRCLLAGTDIYGAVPILVGSSTTGLTDTAPNPAAAISAGGSLPYAYVS